MAKGFCVILLLAIAVLAARNAEACKREDLQKEIMQCAKKAEDTKPPPKDDKEKVKKAACCVYLTLKQCMEDALASTSCQAESSTLDNAMIPFSQGLRAQGIDCSAFKVTECGASATTVALWLLLLAPLLGKYLL